MDRRFIEESFPVKEVSEQAAREKSIRHGHISTLHIWWARRPLASSRATNLAALIPESTTIEEWNGTRDFIAEFSKWNNSLNEAMIKRARQEILKANGGKSPKVIDPFGGGGAIPLEALRLGCETYSNDYNPIAVLIQKCTLEYPQKYGKSGNIEIESEEFGEKAKRTVRVENKLSAEVKKWGEWVFGQARQELEIFYPEEEDGSIPVGYIWARTIPCQNPSCGAEIPLMRQYWLAKKKNKRVSVFPFIENNEVHFKLVGTGYNHKPEDFNPTNGNVSRAIVVCPVCGSTIEAEKTRKLFQQNKASQRLIAIVSMHPTRGGKEYRIANDNDSQVFHSAEDKLKQKINVLKEIWGIEPIPDETLPLMSGVFNVPIYGINSWGDLFNDRQKLGIITLIEKIKIAYFEMVSEGYMKETAKIITTYLAFVVDRFIDYNSSLCVWAVSGEFIAHTFGRQALPMVWDYFELSSCSSATGSWRSAVNWIVKVIEHCSFDSITETKITQGSASSLIYEDNYFDAVFTDPPYYNNVPYSDLSDFFYVWLKRSIGNLYPELFSTPLSPKKKEITEMKSWDSERYPNKDKDFFENNLKESFKEIFRVLKHNGIAIIVYAHKSLEGWETLVNSLLDSGLIMTGAWPIDTEMKARLRAKGSATLSSSIYIVARKIERESTGFYNEVKEELKNHLNAKLDRLWAEGVGGADFFIAAIGSAVEIFGKYEKVIDYEGNIIRAKRLLQDVRKIATDYAVHRILHNGFESEISDMTRFYILWRWNFREGKVEFDEAQKLARSCGIDLSLEWKGKGFIKKSKKYIKVLGPGQRDLEKIKDSVELIDVLHSVLILWERNLQKEMLAILNQSGLSKSDLFFQVAQAISETLPDKSKEKKLIDGFLSGRSRIQRELKKEKPRDLFDLD